MKILFAGTPELAARHLDALLGAGYRVSAVITQPDRPGKRGRQQLASPVKNLAVDRQLQVLQPDRLRAEDIVEFEADLMVVVAYGQILSRAVLDAPRHGCINVHASLLPRWRGAAPIQHAILAGDSITGVTIMQMDEGLDTGDILASRQVVIEDDETTASLTEKLGETGPPALLDVLASINQSRLEPTPQDDRQASYAPKITKADARLDWHRPAGELARAVRAYNPDPVAWAMLDELRVKIWFARPVDLDHDVPGTILDLTRAGVTVSCGKGSLLLTSLQLPLGKGSILNGTDILNARKDLLAPGKRFD